MTVRSLLFPLTLALLLCVFTTPSHAEEVIEAWRGGTFSLPYSVSVNPTDGSCWVADPDGRQVVHLRADGTELWRGWQFTYPVSVSVNSTDGSCWVANNMGQEVVHLAADGTTLWRGGGVDFPLSVSVNPTDGSCWVADFGANEVVHLWADGTEMLRVGGFSALTCVSVNPTDGSCWAGGYSQLVHLAQGGAELWRGGTFSGLCSLSVNSTDGSCWVADGGDGTVVHFNSQGGELWRGAIGGAVGVSVNSADGSCWVAAGQDVVHLAADGDELSRVSGYDDLSRRRSVSANSADGSCWVADFATEVHEVLHLAILGWRTPVFYDVPPYHWAFEDVEACCNSGIVGGYDDGLYHPDWPLSRDQMAVFISRSICTPTGEAGMADYIPPATPSFSDVPTDFWCYKHIEYAAEHSVVAGYEDGTYQPQLPLDRGQMAVFIARAIAGDDQSVPPHTGDPTFPDVPADFWSYRHIEYIAAEEVAGGYYDGLYHPENPCSRDQMAVFITRAFGLT